MATAPCSVPCDPSIFDWMGYAGLLAGSVAFAVLIYVVGRRFWPGSRTVTALTPATLLLLWLVIVPQYPRPTFVPFAVSAGLDGSGMVDPIYLEGTYAVDWRLEPSDSSCRFSADLYTDDRRLVAQLVAATGLATGDAPEIGPLPGASYQIEGRSDCRWRINLTPTSHQSFSAAV